MEFFSQECPRYSDDICAWHFFHTPSADGIAEWKKIRSQFSRQRRRPTRYGRYRKAVNKLAAHLTFSRIRYSGWARGGTGFEPSEEVTIYLLDLYDFFIEQLSSARRSWFP
jgi:hypothetical protein